ncbi:MAG: COX15/CtaA family protein, partial [Pseudomonadota bacterium]
MIQETNAPVNPDARRLVLLKRMATLCALLILAITSISAFIRLANVGLGCADWPQCYGQNLRQAQQGSAAKATESAATVGARMVHRVIAVAALLLIVVMAMACFTAQPVLR